MQAQVYNLTLASANTEYPITLPPSHNFEFQCRTAADVRFAFEADKVATPVAPYFTLKSGGSYWTERESEVVDSLTIYFASGSAGVVVELVVYLGE